MPSPAGAGPNKRLHVHDLQEPAALTAHGHYHGPDELEFGLRDAR